MRWREDGFLPTPALLDRMVRRRSGDEQERGKIREISSSRRDIICKDMRSILAGILLPLVFYSNGKEWSRFSVIVVSSAICILDFIGCS